MINIDDLPEDDERFRSVNLAEDLVYQLVIVEDALGILFLD